MPAVALSCCTLRILAFGAHIRPPPCQNLDPPARRAYRHNMKYNALRPPNRTFPSSGLEHDKFVAEPTFPQGGFCETGSVDLRELHLEKTAQRAAALIAEYAVDAVIHFAASIVPDSVSNPLGYNRMGAQAFRAQPLTAGSPILLKMPRAGWNGPWSAPLMGDSFKRRF